MFDSWPQKKEPTVLEEGNEKALMLVNHREREGKGAAYAGLLKGRSSATDCGEEKDRDLFFRREWKGRKGRPTRGRRKGQSEELTEEPACAYLVFM